jgi:hypothetical protein
MDEEIQFVKLPFLSLDHSVGEAALALKFANCRAAVVGTGDEYRLVMNKEIVKALEHDKQKLKNLFVDAVEPVRVPNILTGKTLKVTTGHVPLDLPRLGSKILKTPTLKDINMAVEPPAKMGIVWKQSADAGLVLVAVTNTKMFRSLRFGTMECKCQNPKDVHYESAPPAGPGKPCKECPYTYDCY